MRTTIVTLLVTSIVVMIAGWVATYLGHFPTALWLFGLGLAAASATAVLLIIESKTARTNEIETTTLVAEVTEGQSIKNVVFSAPRLGVSHKFSANAAVVKWLEEASKEWALLGDEAAETPKFQTHARANSKLLRDIASAVLRNSYQPLKAFEQCCRNEQLLPMGSSVARLVFDKTFSFRDRFFVAAAFVDAAGLPSDFAEYAGDIASRNDLIGEFYAKFQDFRTSGQEARVLYALTSSNVAQQLETTVRLAAQSRQMEDYLAAVRVVAQLGPAAHRWRVKSRWHIVGACVGIAPFIAILSLPILFAGEIGAALKALWALEGKTAEHLKTWASFLKDAPALATIFVIIPALLVAWILRHFSRLFVHNLALASEASNRAAMADVYARMIAQGGAFTPEQQLVVIKRLFGSDDKAGDSDTVPATVAEQVAQLIKPKT
jgi:hypothetical protein